MFDLFEYPIIAWGIFVIVALGAVLYFMDWYKGEKPAPYAELIISALLATTAFDFLMELLGRGTQ